MPEREVYVNAPLRLVTAEYRFPLSSVLAGDDLLSLLAKTLGTALPIIEPAQLVQFSVGADLAPPAITNGYRLLARDRTTAATVTSNRLAVETTAYRHWADFRNEYVETALSALGEDIGALAGLDRVGLRFINELRIPSIADGVEGLRAYINSDLLAASRVMSRGELKTVQAALHLQLGDNAELLMRSGILEGRMVDDSGPLRLTSPPQSGRFFLIDIDSFWTNTGALDEWNTAEAIAISDRLHEPIDELFESCITDTLRDDILRRKV